MDPSKQRG